MSPLTLSIEFEGQKIRMVGTPDDPEWIASDVFAVLGIRASSRPLRDFDDDEKGVRIAHTLGGPQMVEVVTEAGLYRLILRSRKPQARAFRRWVCHEVLPCIRRHGRYPAQRLPVPPRGIPEFDLFGNELIVERPRGSVPLPDIAADIMPRPGLFPLKYVPDIDWLPVKVKPSTVMQWHRNGRRGIYLETVKIKGMIFTCEARVLSYFARLARPAGGAA